MCALQHCMYQSKVIGGRKLKIPRAMRRWTLNERAIVRGIRRRLVVAIRVATNSFLLGSKVKVSDASLPKHTRMIGCW